MVISTPAFLRREALGGEIPFFISRYEPNQQNEVDLNIKLLINRLETTGISVLELNLFDISVEIIKGRGMLDKVLEKESRMDKEKFLRQLQSLLDIEKQIIPAIAAKIAEHSAKVIFLTGIGLVYPFIRSHNVLNNLQSIANDIPTVIFFPGNYNGKSLDLFGLLKDDNYYRAFNIEDYKI